MFAGGHHPIGDEHENWHQRAKHHPPIRMSDLIPTWAATLLAGLFGILALFYVHRLNARRSAVSAYKAAFASGIAAIGNNSFGLDTFSSDFPQHEAAVNAVRPLLPKRWQRKLQKAWDEYRGKDSGLGYDDQGYVAAASATIYTDDKAFFNDFKKRFVALHGCLDGWG